MGEMISRGGGGKPTSIHAMNGGERGNDDEEEKKKHRERIFMKVANVSMAEKKWKSVSMGERLKAWWRDNGGNRQKLRGVREQ